MLPQFTLYARIIFFMMVMFAFATTACSKKTNDYVIMLKNHERALHINAAGKVTATDISLAQFFTMESVTDALSDTFRIALYVKEVGRYLCFRRGKLVGMKHLSRDCHFIEKMDHGYFLYANAYNPQWRVGFTRGLKPVGPRHMQRPQTLRRACFLFVKINAEHFDRDMFTTTSTTTTTTTTTTTVAAHKNVIESRNHHSIRDYGLEEYERRLLAKERKNYRTAHRRDGEMVVTHESGSGGGHRHRLGTENRRRPNHQAGGGNLPQPKNLKRPQPTPKAGEERRKKFQREEHVRKQRLNGQRKRKQVDPHYEPNSQSSRGEQEEQGRHHSSSSSSSSTSSSASVTATSLAATASLAPSALNLVAMLAASRRKRGRRKKEEEEEEQQSNSEKSSSANADLQLVSQDGSAEEEELYDLPEPEKRRRKMHFHHPEHSYYQKQPEQQQQQTTPDTHFVQPQNHKYSNSNAKKFHSHNHSNINSNNNNYSRNSRTSHSQEEEDKKEREDDKEPSHSFSISHNNHNYLNDNHLTKLNTNINNSSNANAILPALPKNFNNNNNNNHSHNNQQENEEKNLNLMTDFQQFTTPPTPASITAVSQQRPHHHQRPRPRHHHQRRQHSNDGVENISPLRRQRHKRDSAIDGISDDAAAESDDDDDDSVAAI
ncbi:myotubularin-related protein DDB_G0290005 [Musca vetustissima]|uniref:myotubularin-related protein DDB_G0290005 n=1 Tax=Musca vetustissima TaxID=27455 RepID=UPI002AB714B4|nr:myotubularin-related protein DDB_G0290005 [Musca vetustissima]